jgi:hypothetical protein
MTERKDQMIKRCDKLTVMWYQLIKRSENGYGLITAYWDKKSRDSEVRSAYWKNWKENWEERSARWEMSSADWGIDWYQLTDRSSDQLNKSWDLTGRWDQPTQRGLIYLTLKPSFCVWQLVSTDLDESSADCEVRPSGSDVRKADQASRSAQ